MRVKPLRTGASRLWHAGNGKLFSDPSAFGPLCGERAPDNRGVATEERYLTCPDCRALLRAGAQS